jgi:uncharacterized protein (UPF0332 family)
MTQEEQDLKVLLDKASQKLDAAKLLLDGQHWDDAASRAYYAAFTAVSAVLKSKEMSFSRHGQTIGAFTRYFVKQGHFPKDYGKVLTKMQRDREAGDYRAKSEISEQIAREDVTFAEEIIEACRKYLSIE